MLRIRIVPIACFLSLVLLVVIGEKLFRLNSQALTMWGYFGHNPLVALLSGHPHGLRYLAYYPVFAFADATGLNVHIVFSLVCCILLLMMTNISEGITFRTWNISRKSYLNNAFAIFIFLLSLLMNGRLIFAFCGYLLLILVGVRWLKSGRWTLGSVALLIFGCLLASVSSGTLLIALAMVGGILFVTLLRQPYALLSSPWLPISVFMTIAIFAGPTIIGINKNLDYYGGGGMAVVHMLEHGAGGIVLDTVGVGFDEVDQSANLLDGYLGGIIRFWWLGVISAGVVAYSKGWRPIKMIREATPQENVVQLAIVFTMTGGLFAYSVLSMSILPFLLLAIGYASRFVEQRRRTV